MKVNHYRYSTKVLFHAYLQGRLNPSELSESLTDLEVNLKEEMGETKETDKGVSFRFGVDGTGVYTIGNIETDLSLPNSHGNKKYLVEMMMDVIELEPSYELQIEFS
jgi:hypothetical protein